MSIPRAPRRSVTSLAIACAIVLLSGWIPALAARASPLSLLGLAANIHIDPALEDSVGHMLQTSATFCDQCRRLGRIRPLRVDVELVRNPPPSSVRPGRAHTVVNRYEFGGIHAVVRLWSRDETAELIAHEFEHVLECAERVNYRARLRCSSPDMSGWRAAHITRRGAQSRRDSASRGSRA